MDVKKKGEAKRVDARESPLGVCSHGSGQQ